MANYNFLSDIDLKSNYQWHCYYVFEDKDFLKELEGLESAYQKHLNSDSHDDTRSSLLKYIDMKFVLADKYRIKHLDLERFRNPRLNSYFGINHNILDIKYDKNSDNIAILMPLDIKKKNYIKAWELVKEIQIEQNVKPRKVRPTEKPDLIYAIFKARTLGKSYREIFDAYQSESLKGYDGRPIQSYSTVDLLKQFYLRYRPSEVTVKDIL